MKLRIRKLSAVGLAGMMLFGLTGCNNQVKLTDEQSDLIAEYVAGTMLKYSYDNEWKYTKLKIAQNTYVPKGTAAVQNQSTAASGTATKTPAASAANSSNASSANGGASGQTSTEDPFTGLASSLGLTGVKISYQRVSVGDSYPTDAYAIAVPALPGYQVAAVEFEVKNTSGSAVTLNSKSGAVSLKLTVSGNNVNQYTSMLKNDIAGLKNVTLAAGESYTAVAVFQVEESLSAQVSGSSLTISAGSSSLGSFTVN